MDSDELRRWAELAPPTLRRVVAVLLVEVVDRLDRIEQRLAAMEAAEEEGT